ncbi:class I SAM-dependent methyltransferase [Asanoa sp. WMMD1127]|uniref:class I SAM-dependent methyltransferase n=1 Tax=Asanoa sp. WMMD1127 TaxID=3016107 RepID=UPI002415AC1E|nr:class I SAM-dependent methyltransferase [Asanoa sp. WMMD1127]MDG4827357.1 class I SAM-dependent methyltransferase [Asanoa sp. WMMD1127]
MEATEIRKLAALEDRHWWYAERRALLARSLRRLGGPPGAALDIGAAGGGNTRVLRAHGWRPVALEYSTEGAEVALERGLSVMRADARTLPVRSGSLDLVTAFDVLEHIDEDHEATAEILRVLRPGGTVLIAVPADMRLWSAHDVAVGHVRRYDRAGLRAVVEKAGLVVDELWSWNVLLKPVAAWRRRSSTGSDLDDIAAPVNLGLRAVVAAERYLPVKSWPGVSLMLRAHRPGPVAER